MKIWIGLSIFALATGCASPPPVSSPASQSPVQAVYDDYLVARNTCAIVYGVDNAAFADKGVTKVWHEILGQIVAGVHEDLTMNGWKAAATLLSTDISGKGPNDLTFLVAMHKCGRVLQITQVHLTENGQNYFEYQINLIRFDKPTRVEGGSKAIIASDYKKTYRFKKNREVFENLHTGTMANTIFEDLDKAGALSSLKAPTK